MHATCLTLNTSLHFIGSFRLGSLPLFLCVRARPECRVLVQQNFQFTLTVLTIICHLISASISAIFHLYRITQKLTEK